MIPAEFDYVRPGSLDEALAALRDGGEDAKLLAGGHSLLPLMKLRMAVPTLLVDLGGVPGLKGIERANGGWRIGAMTSHAAMARESDLGLAAKVAHTIADPQVRHRGLIQFASDPDLGEVPHIRTPIKIGESVRVRTVAPKLGQHNAEIFARLGVSEAEINQLRVKGVM